MSWFWREEWAPLSEWRTIITPLANGLERRQQERRYVSTTREGVDKWVLEKSYEIRVAATGVSLMYGEGAP